MNDNTALVTRLVQKRLILPQSPRLNKLRAEGSSKTLAHQIDSALMQVGFKLSKDALAHLSSLPYVDAFKAAHLLISAVQKLVGDHVAHNVYFRDFPKNVPDTFVFWGELLSSYYEQTGTITFNLLDFATYGSYQHTYEEMLAAHDAFKPKAGKHPLKVINLGGTEQKELTALFASLAQSVVPLNEEDRGLLEQLFRAGFQSSANVPVRENKAVINALWMEAGEAISADTPLDILRLAAHLSKGDVTLTEDTRFISFKRPVRRALVAALDDTLKANPERIEDITSRREQFKRLAAHLHPFEFKRAYPAAIRAFSYASGDMKVQTWGHKVHTAIQTGKLTKAIDLLSEKPGQLLRQLDKVARESNDTQFTTLLDAVRENVKRVSGRVILSLIEHLDNRREKVGYRLFVNKRGTAHATADSLEPLAVKRIDRIQSVLWKEIGRRVPSKETLVLDPSLDMVALPISEKSKSEGFRVLPRGSLFSLDATKPVVRFFIYWHENGERTDYDLSMVTYDKDFNAAGQVSWTSLRYGGAGDSPAVHSGDITSAPNGASEFIDVELAKLPKEVRFLVPTVNLYAGNLYKDCKECFFGFMSRDLKEKGKPFEPRTVETKFDLRGDKKVACPLVFVRADDGSWSVKWLDLYMNGVPYGNRVETNKFSTQLLAKSLVNRRYLTVGRLLEVYRENAGKVVPLAKAKKGVTYIGISQPEGLPEGAEVYTLDNLKALIPA